MRSPCIIKIGDHETGKNKRIIQHIEVMSEGQKKGRLEKLLRQCQPPIIVFINAKKAVDVVAREIGKMGHSACILHGGKKQAEREEAIEAFKKGEYNIMCATDVAGRGLDIDNVQHVINYDMATSIDKYCHRIGRTGRAGKTGNAWTFLTENDIDQYVQRICVMCYPPCSVVAAQPQTIRPADMCDVTHPVVLLLL